MIYPPDYSGGWQDWNAVEAGGGQDSWGGQVSWSNDGGKGAWMPSQGNNDGGTGGGWMPSQEEGGYFPSREEIDHAMMVLGVVQGKMKGGCKGQASSGCQGQASFGCKGQDSFECSGQDSFGCKGQDSFGCKGKDSFGCKGKGSSGGKGREGRGKSGKQRNAQPKRPKDMSVNFSWKRQLTEEYAKQYKVNLTKDTFVYTTLDLEDGTAMSTLTSDSFSQGYSTEEPHETKKEAEEAVAMAALMTEFPAAYAAMPDALKQQGPKASEGAEFAAQPVQPARGVKRKASSEFGSSMPKGTQHHDPKSGVNIGLTILIGRALTKVDTTFTVEEANGSYVATLTVNCLEGYPCFTGWAAESRRLAEQYAAQAALTGLQAQIDAKMPEHLAAKEARKAAYQAEQDVAAVSPQQVQPAKIAKHKATSEFGGSMPKGTQHTDSKSNLNINLTILIGRALTKVDTTYTVEEVNGSCVATLAVHCLEGTQTFTGWAAESRKLAEQYAAEVALAALQARIDAKMPEYLAAKEARKAADQERREAKQAAKIGMSFGR